MDLHVKPGRKAFLASSAAAFASISIPRFPAGAADFTYKFGHDDPATSPVSLRLTEAVAKIKDESGGRMEIQVFPDSQLGSSTAMMTQLRSGAIQFLRQINGSVALIAPAVGIDALPYIYRDSQEAWAARDGALGKYLRGQLALAGLYGFEKTWDLGFRQIHTNVKPINVPDDLRGLKIRVPVDKIEVAFFKAMGASPTPMNMTEVYTALQTHIIDGGELPLSFILSRKFYEVQKYLSVTNHIATGEFTLANSDAWIKLPHDLQDIVGRNFNAAALASRPDMLKSNAQAEADLVAHGMTSNHANVDAFREAVRKSGLYAQWKDDYGAQLWAVLEKSVGPLT